ncbi:MAG: Wzz/FepE/Etk N-terminal domain-containing protein [Clostridiales bacterium]|nr:Wzz/FepE/Etk N-terminal domain-containing protein [Clostridiales bacterium]
MQEKRDTNNEIDLLEIFAVIISKIWIVILSGMLLGAIAFLYSYGIKTPMYTSTTSIYILNKKSDQQVNYNDTMLASQLTKDYQKLIKSRTVMEKVIEECGLNTSVGSLSSRVNVQQDGDTRIINISVKDANPEEAQRIAESVRNAAAVHVKAVTDVEAVNVADYANLPKSPSEPNVGRTTLIGILAGALLSIAVIVVIYLLDDTIKSSDDIERYLGLSTLALIPETNVGNGKKSRKKRKKSKHSAKSGNRQKRGM